jgi:hypothetical protein
MVPGTYLRNDGSVVYLAGKEHFWNAARINGQEATATTSVLCHSGRTSAEGSLETTELTVKEGATSEN